MQILILHAFLLQKISIVQLVLRYKKLFTIV